MRWLLFFFAVLAAPLSAQTVQIGAQGFNLSTGGLTVRDQRTNTSPVWGVLDANGFHVPALQNSTLGTSQSFNPYIPFGNPTDAKSVIYSRRVGSAETLSATVGIARETAGSGVFGPRGADVALHLAARKLNAQTSAIEGEVDGMYIIGEQGVKGDIGGILVDITKRRNQVDVLAANENGAPLGAEIGVCLTNAMGLKYHCLHSIPAFIESPGGLSGGLGHGLWNHVERGMYFSGVTVQGDQVGAAQWTANTVYSSASIVKNAGHLYTPTSINPCTSGSTGPTQTAEHTVVSDGGCSWLLRDADYLNVIVAAHNSDPGSVYYFVNNAGTTCQGLFSARMCFGFEPTTDIWSLSDETGDAKLVVGRTSGVVTALNGFQVGDGSSLVYRKTRQYTATLPSVPSLGAAVLATYTFAGSLAADRCIANVASPEMGFNNWRFWCVVTGANTVEVRVQNVSSATAGGSPVAFWVDVSRYTN